MLRDDLRLIYDWIAPGSRVLDLGCGDGALLAALAQHKNCRCYGVEIATDSVLSAMQRGVNVIQADVEAGLQIFGEKSFDLIVLSQTLQAMRNPETILQTMMRAGHQAVVSFPNFGYWRNRMQLMVGGHMPVSERMPYEWFDTPNIHFCTVRDFERLCAKNGLAINERAVMSGGKTIEFWPNMRASLAFYRVAAG